MKQSPRPREAGGALQGEKREGDCQLEGSSGRKGTEHQGREAELQTAQDRESSHAHIVHQRAHTHTHQMHKADTQTHTAHVHRYTRMYFTVYSQMQDKYTIAYTHVCTRVHTCMPPQAHMPLCAHVHTHIYTCMPVMHPCTGSGRNQLCEHNRD